MTVNINIDNRTITRILVVVAAFLLAISFLSATKGALTLILISAFLAIALNPPVTYISSKLTGGSRGWATAVAYVMVIGVISFFLLALVPPLVDQSREFFGDIPSFVDDLAEGEDAISTFIRDNELDDEVKEYIDSFVDGTAFEGSSSQVLDGLERVGIAIVSTLTVLVLTFLMLIEGPEWVEKFYQLQPKDKRAHRRELGHRMYNVIVGYVNGQLLVAFLASMSSLTMMLIVGLPLPLALAGLVGILGLIPLVGATLAAVIVIIIALFQSIPAAIAMAVFFLLYQQIENNLFQPLIQSRTVDVSPLLVLVAVLFGISFGGLLGALIAIPIAAILRILFLDYLEQRNKVPDKKESTLSKLTKRKT